MLAQSQPTELWPVANFVPPVQPPDRKAEKLARLHEVALAVYAQSELNAALAFVVEQARQLLGADGGAVHVWSERLGKLERLPLDAAAKSAGGWRPSITDIVARSAFCERRRVQVDRSNAWTHRLTPELLGLTGCIISVPLRLGERCLGAFTLTVDSPGRRFDEEDMSLLELLGDMAGSALVQARLAAQAERRAARLEALQQIATFATINSDRGQTLAAMPEQAARLIDADECALYLWDSDQRADVLAAQHRCTYAPPELPSRPGMDGYGARSWQSTHPSTDHLPISFPRHWPRSVVAGAPLFAGGRRLGLLVLVSRGADPLGAEDIRFLELFAAQAAAALERERLAEATARSRALEHLHELKGTFVSSISHDLRTPLTLVLGYAELLQQGRLQPHQNRDVINEIHQSSVLMARLIDDLLDFSRLGRDIRRTKVNRTDVGDLLRSTAEALTVGFQPRSIGIDIQGQPTIMADQGQVRRVVQNLLDNALRYAPTSAVILRARIDRGRVIVEVIDHGPGIPLSERERVFEPLHRGSGSSLQPLRGAGLGLAIARQIIEAHGGSIGVESNPGQGSRFWFSLDAA